MTNILTAKFPPDLNNLYTEELANQLANTQGAISALNQLQRQLQNPLLLMRPILAKEAESSSRLEGTQASIDDVYKIDILNQSDEKRNQALEVRNYQDAMLTGISILKRFKLNTFLIREIHKALTKGVRGKEKTPGEFRKGEVWIGTEGTDRGNARYIPPDALHIKELMANLESFIISRGSVHPLIACGLIHHRFEGIHPFNDGNGRTGRLLMSLYLIKEGLLDQPIIYISGYFERNRNEYLEKLSLVDKQEKWYSWLIFFLRGLEVQSKASFEIGLNIDKLFRESRQKIENERAGLNLIRVLEFTFTMPYITTPIITKHLKIPSSSIQRYLETLSKKNILIDIGIHFKERVYANLSLIKLLQRV